MVSNADSGRMARKIAAGRGLVDSRLQTQIPVAFGVRTCWIVPVMANATNVLASGIDINGSIRFSNDMIIDGKIEGEIISDKGRVTIGENAQIKGDVTAGEVKVFGKVEGKITSERCELKTDSRLIGDIKTKSIVMEDGASHSGRSDIGG